MAPHPNEVFVSYSTLDWRFADEITKMLRHHHVPLWDSRSSILPGQDWHDEIGHALRRCDWFVILLSSELNQLSLGTPRAYVRVVSRAIEQQNSPYSYLCFE